MQVGGGVVLDRIGSSVPNALLLCAAAVGAGGLFCALSFAAARSLASFAPLFALGELGLFAIQACICLSTAAAKGPRACFAVQCPAAAAAAAGASGGCELLSLMLQRQLYLNTPVVLRRRMPLVCSPCNVICCLLSELCIRCRRR